MVFSEVSSKPTKYKATTKKKYSDTSDNHGVIRSAIDINEIVPEFLDRERIGPHTPEGDGEESVEDNNPYNSKKKSNATVKRRNRRNKLKSLRSLNNFSNAAVNNSVLHNSPELGDEKNSQVNEIDKEIYNMSDNKPRDDVLAARQAKKLAKQKGKGKDTAQVKEQIKEVKKPSPELRKDKPNQELAEKLKEVKQVSSKSKDEVDKACLKVESLSIDSDKDKEQIKAERAAKKAAKQAKKKGTGDEVPKIDESVSKVSQNEQSKSINQDMTVKDVVETLRDIVNVAKDINDVTEKVRAINFSGNKSQPEESCKSKTEEGRKSKSELKAERRAKQEAQRAVKQAAQEQKVVAKPKPEAKATAPKGTTDKAVKISKPKSSAKPKVKLVNSCSLWFQHLYKEQDMDRLRQLAFISNLHPAIIKLGVQLATKVITGSNARCIALLNALKKMVRDYTLPAKTEFSRGLDAHLAASLDFLWAHRAPTSSQINAIKYFRYHLTQLPNNVDEFDAKKTLQEEIDRYIREQIEMAGEAISITVRNKISNGDIILTYGCSSLIERILKEAWSAGVTFHTIVVGSTGHSDAVTHCLRTLGEHGLDCTYLDICAISCVMPKVNKVIVGASALLSNGAVLGRAGTAQIAAAARTHNVPVLVACETHKCSQRPCTDAFAYNEIGGLDEIIDESDPKSILKGWQANKNLGLLSLTYDVTPASLITAVVTELAIVPCTSAPVVLRYKLSEYGLI